MTWITENIGTIVVCAALVCVTAAVVVKLVRDRKRGKSSCGCGCSGCAMAGSCHKKKQKSEKGIK